MKCWLINQYNMPPEFGHLNRHYNFGKYLNRMGHEPTVFVGSFLHNTQIQMIDDKSIIKKYENTNYPFYFIKTCNYSSSKLKRVYAMYEFYRNMLNVAKKIEKPDVILGSSAHPLAAVAAIKLGKKLGCQSIVEVRDLWPESLVAYGIIKENNPIVQLLYAGEKWIYKNADKIVFTMEGGKDYLIDQRWNIGEGGPIDINKVFHLNNGVDLEVFNSNKENFQIRDKDLNDSSTFKVIYTGSIRLVNNVKSIIDAASEVMNLGVKDIKFIIYGDGSDKEFLEKYCIDNKIDNVVFKGWVDKKYIPYILSQSNLNIIHFEQNKIKKYGASLNKMFDYFASGKPVISDCEFGYDLIKKYNCGFVKDSSTPEELAQIIAGIKRMPKEEYSNICDNSLKAANDYNFTNLANELVEIIGG